MYSCNWYANFNIVRKSGVKITDAWEFHHVRALFRSERILATAFYRVAPKHQTKNKFKSLP